jgi:ergothioneine biosynthesis protein EgtB
MEREREVGMASQTAIDVSSRKVAPLAEQFAEVRRTTEHLVAHLSAEDCMVQSMPEASPAKWHLAHTTWFYETFILTTHSSGYKPLNPDFRYLFNSYYNAVGGRPLRQVRGAFSRPSLDEVRAYRRHVNEAMLELLANDRGGEVAELTTLGINHEQQHQELIVTDAKHALWTNPLQPALLGRSSPEKSVSNTGRPAEYRMEWKHYEAGLRSIGHSGDGFAFDNESPRHEVYVQEFSLGSRLITNREYMQFMDNDGYSRPEFWLSDAWEVLRANNWQAPLYWERDKAASKWQYYTSAGILDVNPDQPVCHVSFYEADAYARWAGARLMTEAEWEVTASEIAAQGIQGNFLEDGRLHPQAHSAKNQNGLQQLFGDVWEWTQSPYVAYPGYRPAAGALGEYNAKFMCNQMVLRGGSCATPGSHIRASYRNFFPPHTRWQFSGIRLAKDGR